jgi:hypothetical protein
VVAQCVVSYLAFSIGSHDHFILRTGARSGTLPWFQIRRARTALALAAVEGITGVALPAAVESLGLTRRAEPATATTEDGCPVTGTIYRVTRA